MKLIKVKDSELKEKSDQIRNLQAELETTKEKLKVPEKKEISLHTKKISTQDTIVRALTEESSRLKQKVLQLSKSYGERDDASELEKENQAMTEQQAKKKKVEEDLEDLNLKIDKFATEQENAKQLKAKIDEQLLSIQSEKEEKH